jgi:hypothetical protein
MAGTATEQFVGLGKPAIAIPGKGPQFTPAFAEAQTRLLGPSLILVEQPDKVASVVQQLLHDPDWLQLIAENGSQRMGQPGAASRIANCLMERFESFNRWLLANHFRGARQETGGAGVLLLAIAIHIGFREKVKGKNLLPSSLTFFP